MKKSKINLTSFFICTLLCIGCAATGERVGPNVIGNRTGAVLPADPNQNMTEDLIGNYMGANPLRETMPKNLEPTTPYSMPDTVERAEQEIVEKESINTRRAAKIASSVNKLAGIEKTTVVITGNTALVGIDLMDYVLESEVAPLKSQVEKSVRAADGEVRNVAVTATPELVERITAIAGDIGRGRPATGLADEMGSLLRRATPMV